MGRWVAIVVAGLLVAVVVAVASAAGLVAVFGGTTPVSADVGPSTAALSDIPAEYLHLFQAAAATCPGLPWTVLAGIGRVETDFGQDDQASSAGAVGPMQFLPATFAAYDSPVPPGGATPPSPDDPTDAVYAAARLLCANGARDGADIPGAIYAYDHSEAYVAQVLSYAASYTAPAPATAAPDQAAAEAVRYALAQVGTPYVWGGETPGVGFDCSGLTQAAYAAAGIAIPRTSEAQWSALPHVGLDDLEPGDLLFFDPGERIAGLPGHVGIYIGGDQMVDAPHTGADVRIEDLADRRTPMGAARPTAGTRPAATTS
ncbi:MAG TPA: NlpC/P60 family protein [Acidimicrobiales bacterium]|nr:NlpC/P60 family protein [Acidimicrobiales bacterium]